MRQRGNLKCQPDATVIVRPLADGGEGTTDALIEGLGATKIDITVTGPLGKPVHTYYGLLPDTNTAVLEMASAAGITLLAEEERILFAHPLTGVGEMIKDAIVRLP